MLRRSKINGPYEYPTAVSGSFDDSTLDSVDSPFASFRRLANQFPLLTAEEEIELSKRIQRGDEQAVTTFYEHNLRLLISRANHLAHLTSPSFSLMDIILSGASGLMTAVKKYNWKFGNRFSTMAVIWIDQAMKRELSQNSRIIRLPLNKIDQIRELHLATIALQNELGYLPDPRDLATRLEWSVAKVKEIIADMRIEQIDSLDQPCNEDDDKSATIGELTADVSGLTVEELSERGELDRLLYAELDRLNPKDRLAIEMTQGLNGYLPHTLSEVGRVLKVTRARAGQRNKGVKKRLRDRRSKLAQFVLS